MQPSSSLVGYDDVVSVYVRHVDGSGGGRGEETETEMRAAATRGECEEGGSGGPSEECACPLI